MSEHETPTALDAEFLAIQDRLRSAIVAWIRWNDSNDELNFETDAKIDAELPTTQLVHRLATIWDVQTVHVVDVTVRNGINSDSIDADWQDPAKGEDS